MWFSENGVVSLCWCVVVKNLIYKYQYKDMKRYYGNHIKSMRCLEVVNRIMSYLLILIFQ
jgi:hypothetical protein